MKRILVAGAFALALGVSLLAASGAEPVTVRLPLAIVASARIDRVKVPSGTPLITVGSLTPTGPLPAAKFYPAPPTHWQPVPALGDCDPLIKDLLAGDRHFTQADSKSDTVICVDSQLNMFACDQPVALSRKGNVITLELMTGVMDVPWGEPAPPSPAIFLLSVGKLPVGDYELDVRVVDLAGDGKTWPLYARKSIETGLTAFTVRDGNTLNMATKPASTLKAGEMKTEADGKAGALCQLPGSIPLMGEMGKGQEYSVIVGSCPGYPFDADKPANGDAPEVVKPQAGAPSCALIRGATLNSGQWMSLRDISWDGMTAKITVEIWRDNAGRGANEPFSPLLLVPLNPRKNVGAKAAPPKVMVSFHGMTAAVWGDGQPYVPDDADIKYVEAQFAK